jgi:hypothetical protein
MLNKIAFIILVSAFSVASTETLASDGRTQDISNKSLPIVHAASSEGIEKQVVQVVIVKNSGSQNILSKESGKEIPILPETGWLLGVALIGFVMLSNRSSI